MANIKQYLWANISKIVLEILTFVRVFSVVCIKLDEFWSSGCYIFDILEYFLVEIQLNLI